MTDSDPYHLLGKFVVTFQQLENQVKEIILLLVQTKDDEMISILMHELDNSARLKTVDVLFQRFTSMKNGDFKEDNTDFHQLIEKIKKLGARRNKIVHSLYFDLITENGELGLFRQNSKLSTNKKGERKESEEDLLPKDLLRDITDLDKASGRLESYRLKIINWVL